MGTNGSDTFRSALFQASFLAPFQVLVRWGCRGAALIALILSTSASIEAQVTNRRSSDFQVESLGISLRNGTTPLLSRSGNSIVGIDPSGELVVIRNAFQFDQESSPLPAQFASLTVLAVSYYGAVFGARDSTASGADPGCAAFVYSSKGEVLPVPLPTLANGMQCSITAAVGNVADRFVYLLRAGTRTLLILYSAEGSVTLWDSASQNVGANVVAGSDVRLESYALNDLNTAVFTLSSVLNGKRSYSSYFWVPAREILPLKLPATLGSKTIVRDVNNKNKYLIALKSGIATYDPAKKRIARYRVPATRLASGGAPYTAALILDTPSSSLRPACFLPTGFGSIRIGAVNDEREITLVANKGGQTVVSKVIPLTASGFPRCG